MSVRSLLALRDEFDIAFVIAVFVIGGLLWLVWPWTGYSLKARVDALEQRVEAIEKEGSR